MHIVQLGGKGHRHAIVDTCDFSIGAAAHYAHYPVTHDVADNVRAGGNHLACDLQSDDRRIAEVRAAIAAVAMGQVGPVDARRVDAHQQIGGAYIRGRGVAQFEHVGAAEFFKGNGFHEGLISVKPG